MARATCLLVWLGMLVPTAKKPGSASTSGSNITKLEESTFLRYLWIFLLIKKAATFALCVKSYKNVFAL